MLFAKYLLLISYLLTISVFGSIASAQASGFVFEDPPSAPARPAINPVTQPTPITPTVTEPKVPAISAARPASLGGQMSDCEILPGPVAYNIGNPSGTGIGGQCRPRSVVVGFQGGFSSLPQGTTGMGYINPRLENQAMVRQFPGDIRVVGDEFNEPVYLDYGSSAAIKYISYQVDHWKKQGRARIPIQKCVAVDIDNCDVIGAENYGKVLDVVDKLNREIPDVQIRVLIKNPQKAGCGQYLKRSVAVGAFMEELTPNEFERLKTMRDNPNQIMVYARGNNRKPRGHISMDEIAAAGVPNTTVSFDPNGSYKSITKCTYTGKERTVAVAPEAAATR